MDSDKNSTFGSGFFLTGFVKKITKSPRPCMEPQFELADYYPIFLYLAIIILFVIATMIVAHTVGPRRATPVKMMPYESGMDPIGDARQRFDVKFYLVAIMFLVFDVELLFLYPWAVVAYQDGGYPAALKGPIFWGVLAFIGLLLVAYIYDWRKGVFKWR
jgi:NADH:ubiquinone oxidoreductase subunit 3 (subunit A)